MTDYRQIYDKVFRNEPRYNLAENSPGLRVAIKATEQLSMLTGRSLDIGCGAGFVVEYLSGADFQLHAYGVDISAVSVDLARDRLQKIPGIKKRLQLIDSQQLPFQPDYFALVTCFDVLEHIDVADIETTLLEVDRILRRGGLFMGAVSCRKSGMHDLNGDNLHRTVQGIGWWVDRILPDRVAFDRHRSQLVFWKQKASRSKLSEPILSEHPARVPYKVSSALSESPKSSAMLYQRIYEEHPWYGDAAQGRCPGVRLLPKYRDWLLSPVIDLGCGRGQTVQQLRKAGLEADGVDQVELHPSMQVGDIAQPIDGISKYRSAICIDCIEHLHDNQVAGLFANMKRVKRQAFSIHNGEATGTGEELHINKRSFADWKVLIAEHFRIVEEIKVHDQQFLYLTEATA